MTTSIAPVDVCSICMQPLGASFEAVDERDNKVTRYVAVLLHQPTSGLAHWVHRICAYDVFVMQLEKEPVGIDPNDTENLPFSCPLCRYKLTLQEANRAAGIDWTLEIRNKRLMDQIPPEQSQETCCCTIL